MNIFLQILGNKVFASAAFGSLFGTILKSFFKKLNLNNGNSASYGGMPSGHTSFAMAGAWSVGINLGFDSPIFGVSLIWATLVIFDALGLSLSKSVDWRNVFQNLLIFGWCPGR